MKTATVRQLRHDFGSVLNWVEEGEAVSISKRGKIIALLSPPPRDRRSRGGEAP
jgi:prevent-host-death family protein